MYMRALPTQLSLVELCYVSGITLHYVRLAELHLCYVDRIILHLQNSVTLC